ncbi:MAG: hypothetical protein NTY57_05280 [Solirubrobacterales bacterium]|nr:hypothetical protein [Solirubrobacterales bacterium]
MTTQRYRFRAPSTGADVLIDADPGQSYQDTETGETLLPVGAVLPLGPSGSRLPWAVENLRACEHCGQFSQRDVNVCPTCGRRVSHQSL